MGRLLPLVISIAFISSVYGQSPGGVTGNLQLWLRAEGYTGGTTWADNSGNSRTATKSGTVLNTTLYNFQPVPTNLTTANFFTVPHHTNLNTNNGAISVFAVGLAGSGAYSPFVAKTTDQTWPTGWVLATSDPTSHLGFTTGDWEGVGTTNVAKQTGVPTTVPYIASGFGSGASTNVVSVCYNGTAVATNTSTKTSSNMALRVGFDGDAYGFSGGNIAEVIMYNASLSAAQRAQVWSYLAIKYGITLNNGATNYVSSAAATVWNTATNTGYNNNIFGIGRDNTSGLHQRQSRSINADLQPVISNGSTLVSLNSAGTDITTNSSFLIAGSDNGSTVFGTELIGLANLNHRLNRIWKVQESGTVGTVAVAWPASDTLIQLVVSSNAVFDGADAAYATTAITINGVPYRQASVNLTNGQYFTFATKLPAPGGVFSSLSLWLASDAAGVAPGSNAPHWDDLSKWDNPVESVGTRTLRTADAAHNFQPYFDSFSSSSHFKDANSSLAPQNSFETTEVTLFAVARINSATNDGRIMGIDDGDLNGGDPGLSIFDAKARFHRVSTGGPSLTSTAVAQVARTGVFSSYTSGTTLGVGVDGVYNTSTITAGGGIYGDILMIGYGNLNVVGALPGDLQEVVWYKRSLSATERNQVESYLAMKHGITRGGNTGTGAAFNYLNSAAAIVWNKTTNAGYNNDIAGIGRDDGGGLMQKQSNSVNATGSVTIGLGTIAANNAANATGFSQDKSFLMWGHDGASHQTVFTDTTCFNLLPTDVEARIQRKWKVQVTNFAQNTTVGFLQSALVGFAPVANLRLLVDDDGVDWSNATVYSGASSTGGRIQFGSVVLSAAQPYFTLGTINYDITPLPIELVRFEGAVMGAVNQLTWTTASEQDNAYFDLERSADGTSFERIATVNGAGNSQHMIHYVQLDGTPLRGLNYYRLRQVDLDGTFTHSNTVALFNTGMSGAECTVRTLDAEGLFAFNCTAAEDATLELFSPAGQPLQFLRSGSDGTYHVDLRSLAAGVYFARITDGGVLKTYKLVRP